MGFRNGKCLELMGSVKCTHGCDNYKICCVGHNWGSMLNINNGGLERYVVNINPSLI